MAPAVETRPGALASERHPSAAPEPRVVRLPAFAVALACVLLVFTGIQIYVESALPRRLPVFASTTSPVKLTGTLLTASALETPDVLPIFGSSELDREADNRPDEFFRGRPTGFTVFPVGRGGTTCLMILQKVAAAGRLLQGHKTVVILSPTWFSKGGVNENAVDANTTVPQVGAWLFRSALSLDLKSRIARRLRQYPTSLRGQPLLNTALAWTADPTVMHRLFLAAVTPLGRLQDAILARVEYCAILREFLILPPRLSAHLPHLIGYDPNPGGGASGPFDWERLAKQAEGHDRKQHAETFYSATNRNEQPSQRKRLIRFQAPSSRDADFISKMQQSTEWDDLGLLIDALKQLGADALFISQPFNGLYRDLGGTSPEGRRAFYEQLSSFVQPSGFGVRDFSDFEEDRYFFNDTGHPSAKAWIYYDREIDNFYRGLPD